MAKVFTGRYVLFSLPYFIIILSTNLSFIKLKPVKPKLLALILFVVTLIPNLFFITRLLTGPYTLPLPPPEAGYINDWTSGWGIKDISIYLKNRSKLANVIVGTEGFFGTLPDGLQIYTDGTPQLTIVGVGVNLDSIPSNLIEAKNYGDEVYLLINPHRNFLNPDSLKKLFPISTYPRPDGTSLILYYLQST